MDREALGSEALRLHYGDNHAQCRILGDGLILFIVLHHRVALLQASFDLRVTISEVRSKSFCGASTLGVLRDPLRTFRVNHENVQGIDLL